MRITDLCGQNLVNVQLNQYLTKAIITTESNGKEKKYQVYPQIPTRFKQSIKDRLYDMDNLLKVIGNFQGKITFVKIETKSSIEYGKQLNDPWSGENRPHRPWLTEERKTITIFSYHKTIQFIGELWEFESLGQAKVCYTSVFLDELGIDK